MKPAALSTSRHTTREMRRLYGRRAFFAALVTACSLLSGCGSSEDNSLLNGIGNLNPFRDKDEDKPEMMVAAPKRPPPPPIDTRSLTDDEVDCPHVEVLEGTSAVRVGGNENSQVRYQYSIGELTRACSVNNGNLTIKVGVAGRVLLGPVGVPGTFQIPIRVAVRRNSDLKVMVSNLYHTSATVTSAETHAEFSVVADPMTVPLISAAADSDYMVLVGFDNGKAPASGDTKAKKRRGK